MTSTISIVYKLCLFYIHEGMEFFDVRHQFKPTHTNATRVPIEREVIQVVVQTPCGKYLVIKLPNIIATGYDLHQCSMWYTSLAARPSLSPKKKTKEK